MNAFIKSFVKRGRGLSSKDRDILENYLPQYKIDQGTLVNLDTSSAINFEIGFGSGEFINSIAQKNPEQIFIGCEPYTTGVVKLLKNIKKNNIENIYIFNDDARILLQEMPEAFLNRVFILFPDPWPKARHHKRRVINQALLNLLEEKMKKGSKLLIATDHADYREWILEELEKHPSFTQNSEEAWKEESEEYVETSYHRKARNNNISSSFMSFTVTSDL
jgi:tRNA (guanine-N7-)-methyltransferase